LGVTGREPLNNQPYFRMTRLDDGTPVHPGGRAAFDYMLGLVRELEGCTEEQAAGALASYISVRREYLPTYADHEGSTAISPWALADFVAGFVAEQSENGRRAQAVAAGLMDTVFGPQRVTSGRINDPSRNHPGDVCVAKVDGGGWEKAIEVRDKPVSASDVQIFGRKCLELGVQDAAVLMTSEKQKALDGLALEKWAEGFGLSFTLFVGWKEFVGQALYWSAEPKMLAAGSVHAHVYRRLIEVEASEAAVEGWRLLGDRI
jgi:hypothetical protein